MLLNRLSTDSAVNRNIRNILGTYILLPYYAYQSIMKKTNLLIITNFKFYLSMFTGLRYVQVDSELAQLTSLTFSSGDNENVPLFYVNVDDRDEDIDEQIVNIPAEIEF